MVIVLPPFDDGVNQVTVAVELPVIAVTPVGADGATAFGVTVADAVDGKPVPSEFVAVTVNEYSKPLVKLVTTQVRVVAVVQNLEVSCTAVTR